jgi:hypothetical protein
VDVVVAVHEGGRGAVGLLEAVELLPDPRLDAAAVDQAGGAA